MVNIPPGAPNADELAAAQRQSDQNFRQELESLINRYSRENGSNTPDWILADYLVGCLENWDKAVTAREKWYGRGPEPVFFADGNAQSDGPSKEDAS